MLECQHQQASSREACGACRLAYLSSVSFLLSATARITLYRSGDDDDLQLALTTSLEPWRPYLRSVSHCCSQT